MSGPVNPPLKITDTDGTPAIRPAREIIFDSTDFTLTESSSGTASVSVAAGAGSSLTDSYIAFGSATDEITGSSVFTYTTPGSLPTVTIGDSTLQDAGGNFKLNGKDNLQISTDSTYGSIKMYPATGTTNAFEIAYTGKVTVNPDQNANGDFVVDGETTAGFFTADVSAEMVTITCSDNTDTLVLKSTDADANVGPIFTMFRDEGAPGSTDDFLGQMTFKGNDSAENTTTYASINSYIVDATNTSEDGLIWFSVMTAGTEREKLRIINNQVEVNAIARSDCDFRVRGSGVSDLFFCDSSQGNVGVGLKPIAAGPQLQVDEDASFLLPVDAKTANHDILAEQAHGYVLQMKTGAGTGTFTLPEVGVIGMHVTCVNFGAGMNVAVDASSSHTINGGGSAGNSTTATVTAAGARYDLVYIANDVWNCTAPAVVSVS